MKDIKSSYIIVATLVLSGCQNPIIVESYDEFKKTKVCKLQSQQIQHDWGLASYRTTIIDLEKQSDEMIKAVLTARIITKLFSSYDHFDHNPTIKFILTNTDNKIEELVFHGQDLSITHGLEEVYGTYRMSLPARDAMVTFTLNQRDLRKIISAPKAEFFFAAGKDPIKGEFRDGDKESFKMFLDKCAPLSEVRK
jgi:hypothetical protein